MSFTLVGVISVSFGVLVFIMIFCYAKRQITRYALKSSRGPHELIGHNAPEALLMEIERRLKRVKEISIEPQLVYRNRENDLIKDAETNPNSYYYRMKALDNVSELYHEIRKCHPNTVRKVGIPFRVFLYEQRQSGCLEGMRLEIIEKFCNFYEHARHEPKEFTRTDYNKFIDLLRLLINYIQTKSRTATKDTSPSPTDRSDKSDSSMKKLISHSSKPKLSLGDPSTVRYTPLSSGRKLHENLIWSSADSSNRTDV